MKNYHHGNLKKELIEAACFLCERDGYTKLSIRSLAKESNVSQTAPYRHFKTKECVYAAVAEEGFKKLGKVTYFDPSKKISTNDILELIIPKPKKASLKPYKYKLDIAYEDQDLMIINKSGIAIISSLIVMLVVVRTLLARRLVLL